MRAAFTTLGCKVNQYETEMLAELFAKEGYEVVEPHDFADLYVVNSCTVTASGDRKTRQLLRRLKKQNPAAKAALTGCYPQAFPEEAAAIPEADIVTGSKNRAGLLAAVSRAFQTGQRVVAIEPHEKGESFEHMSVTGLRGRTRAFVKIQDGCERYCSYCIIPKARGPVRSKPLAEIRAELQNLAANGYREAVLVGINLSSYGKDLGLRLIDAVEEACRVEGIERVRLGSLEPELLTGEDIARMAAQKKFCPQFHLALQSGCDKEDFLESLAFVKQMAFAKVHVFAYSRREGTAAAKRPEQAPESVKEDRSRRMIEATEEVRRAFLMSQLGRTEEVLVETTHSPLGYEGFTKNYTPVYVNCGPEACGKVCKVRLEAVLEGHCTGTLEP